MSSMIFNTNYYCISILVSLLLLSLSSLLWWRWRRLCSNGRLHGKQQKQPVVLLALPFIGVGVAFRKNAAKFLLQCRALYGSCITMQMPFQRIHFLLNPQHFDVFLQHKDLDFGPIQSMVNANVFQFHLPHPSRYIRDTGKDARRSSQLGDCFSPFLNYLHEGVEQLCQPQQMLPVSLSSVIVNMQFRAIFNSIYGTSDNDLWNHWNFSQHLNQYQRYFNYIWMGFPVWLFPSAARALRQLQQTQPSAGELLTRPDLSSYMRFMLTKLQKMGASEDDVRGHNLVYTHIQYNTVKATFWLVAHLIHSAAAQHVLVEEIDQLLRNSDTSSDGCFHVDLKEMESLPYLDSMVNETLRLSSGVLVIREVTNNTQMELQHCGDAIQRVTLRKGDKVSLFPPALHYDPEIFANPKEFQFDRFVNRQEFFYKDFKVKMPTLAFGYLCPGQRLARAHMKWTVICLFANCHVEFASDCMPQYDVSHYGHEILPPVADVPVMCRRKDPHRPLIKLAQKQI